MTLYPVSHCSCCFFSLSFVCEAGEEKYLRVCRPRSNHRHAAGNRPLSPAGRYVCFSIRKRDACDYSNDSQKTLIHLFWRQKPSSHVQLHKSKITFTVMLTADVDSVTVTATSLCFTPIFMYCICMWVHVYVYVLWIYTIYTSTSIESITWLQVISYFYYCWIYTQCWG